MSYVSLRDLLRAAVVIALALLLPWLAVGQDPPKQAGDKAAISGVVTDNSGAVVTGAIVVLNERSGIQKADQTDDRGAYSFTGLDVGTYSLSITSPDFAQKVMDNLAVTAGLELPLDVALELASAKSEINVESGALGKVETETAAFPARSPKRKSSASASMDATSRNSSLWPPG